MDPNNPYGEQPPQPRNQYPAPYPTTGFEVSGVPMYQGAWDLNVNDLLVNPPGATFNTWWGRTMAIIKRNWRRLLAIAALLNLLPSAIFVAVVIAVFGTTLFTGDAFKVDANGELTNNPFSGVSVGLFIAVLVLGVVVIVLCSAAAQGAVAWLVTNDAAGNPTSLSAAIGYGFRRVLGVFGYNFLVGLMAVLGLCACILPGIYLYLAFSLVTAVYLFERTNPLGRGWRLFHGNFGAVLGRVLLVVAVGVSVNIAFSIIQNLVRAAAGNSDTAIAVALGIGLLGNLIVLFLPPFQAVAYVTIYAEQRARETPTSAASLAHQLATV